MKFLIVFAVVIVSALAAPPKQAARPARASDSANAQILKYENDNIGLDGLVIIFKLYLIYLLKYFYNFAATILRK